MKDKILLYLFILQLTTIKCIINAIIIMLLLLFNFNTTGSVSFALDLLVSRSKETVLDVNVLSLQ